jgi:hypothetical protein
VLTGTQARAYCNPPNQPIPQCYAYVSWRANYHGYNCSTPQGKWCDRVNPSGSFWYTQISFRNWGSYSEVKTAADAWNAGYTSTTYGNSIYLFPTTNSVNDIDLETANYGATPWWGVTTMPGKVTNPTTGCFPDNSINIKLNSYHIGGSSARRMHTALHEFGHGFGLGHTSSTLYVMNATQGVSTLTDCDKKGVDSLYP